MDDINSRLIFDLSKTNNMTNATIKTIQQEKNTLRFTAIMSDDSRQPITEKEALETITAAGKKVKKNNAIDYINYRF